VIADLLIPFTLQARFAVKTQSIASLAVAFPAYLATNRKNEVSVGAPVALLKHATHTALATPALSAVVQDTLLMLPVERVST